MNVAVEECRTVGLCLLSVLISTGAALAQGSLSGGAGLGGHLPALAHPSGGVASATSGSLVWTYASGQENWIGRTVALGNHGENVFTEFDGYNGSTRLFSVQDANPPTPLWQDHVPFISSSCQVDAAESADVQVSLRLEQADATALRVPTVSRYASNSSTPKWSYSFPFTVTSPVSGIHISRDGQTIVAWVYYGALKTAVAVFSPASATPRSYTLIYTAGMPMTADLSADGSTLLMVSNIKHVLFKTASATLALDGWNMVSVGAGYGISADGSIYAISRGRQYVDVFRNYQPYFTADIGIPEPACSSIEIDDSGSTMALGWNFGSPYLETRVQIVDLVASTHPVVFTDSIIGVGAGRMNVITDIDLSADGKVLAVGTSGDADNVAPGVVVYERAPTWNRSFAQDLPGTVNDVDVSGDGKYIVAASKAVHMQTAGSGGRIDLFQRSPTPTTNQDLTWEGTPSIGSTLVFHHSGLVPGSPAQILVSPNLALPPVEFPGVGILYLKRDEITVEAVGTADANGVFTGYVTIDDDPALIGQTYYVQGMGTEPAQLGHDWLAITVIQ